MANCWESDYSSGEGCTTTSSAAGTNAFADARTGLKNVTRGITHPANVPMGTTELFALVLRDGSRPVLKGLVLGMAIGMGARMAIIARVYTNVSLVDPWLMALLPIPFIAAALAACSIPAARAARVDPNVALREL